VDHYCGGTLQAMEFVDAKKMCGHALLIHTNHCDSGSLEEARDRKLLATIHTAEGDHGKALDSLVYANSIFVEHAEEVKTCCSCPKVAPQRSLLWTSLLL
jgi:hypothetical protein